MEIGKNLKRIRKQHKLTLEQLANGLNKISEGEMNFNKGRISKWENGKEEPRLSSVKLIADFYGINIDSLYTNEVSKNNITTIYNQLNKPRKEKVYNFAEHQLEEQNKIVEFPEKINVLGQTAAGSPVDYGDPDIEEKEFKSVPKGAQYALNVKGDSMEPLIKDGSIVFYKEQPNVESGEIAIVEVDGDGVTCKKVKLDYDHDKIILQSLNNKYDDLELEGNQVRIIGKVVL